MIAEALTNRHVLVVGGSNQIAAFLIRLLDGATASLTVISRSDRPEYLSQCQQSVWFRDVDQCDTARLDKINTLIWIAPYHLFQDVVTVCPQLNTVLGFSSASVYSKAESSNQKELSLVEQLKSAEQLLRDYCEQHQLAWAIFRPTMIYGAGLDQNLTRIARLIERWGWFILPMASNGLRQPVHAADLAQAAINILQSPASLNACYDLGGGEQLSYQDMVRRVFQSISKPPKILKIPGWLFVLAIQCVRLLPSQRDLTTEMVYRMRDDLCVDHSAAVAAFNYQSRKFSPGAECWQCHSDHIAMALNTTSE